MIDSSFLTSVHVSQHSPTREFHFKADAAGNGRYYVPIAMAILKISSLPLCIDCIMFGHLNGTANYISGNVQLDISMILIFIVTRP